MLKKNFVINLSIGCLIFLLSISAGYAQRKRPVKQKAKPQEIVFAVTDDGQSLEPIGVIDKGSLEPATGGDAEPKALNDFTKTYYQPNTKYQLIFGGANAGTVTVKSSNTQADLGKNIATVTTQSTRIKLKGLVMALATNAAIDKTASGTRRKPTANERAEIETLVREEFVKQNITADALKTLNYQNLTALDVDNDKKAELVGSFWVETSPTSRALLFFIADKTANGKYSFGYSDFKSVKKDDVMSGEIKDVDTGIYHELLLDAMEYDGDTTAEIFTMVQSFEGSGFNVYSRRNGKWTKVFEGSNYHGAF